jgi:predicted DNA-binding protein (MmcQ/YjbR family)
MDIEWIRSHCLSLPGATEQVQWGCDLVFKVGGKMFAVTPTEPAPVCMSFKCSDEEFAELTERPGVIPAPYLARARWVALESQSALQRSEICRLLTQSHALVLAKLPKKLQERILASPAGKRRAKPAKSSIRSKRKKRRF